VGNASFLIFFNRINSLIALLSFLLSLLFGAFWKPWYSDSAMARVNIIKQIKQGTKWTLRSIPRKESGNYDWTALPDGDYFIEWREDGRRRRQPAGDTAAQAFEAQRRKRHELEAFAQGLAPLSHAVDVAATDTEAGSVRKLVIRYLDQIKTLKKPNTHRKYDAVLTRFMKRFDGRTL